MRRIAFLAAASIAFIEISEPISAYTIKKDKSGCIDKKTKVGKLDCDEINAGPNLVARIDPKNICSFNWHGTDYDEAKGKCDSGCYDKIAEKYGMPWSYGDLSPADQRSWMQCVDKCEKDFQKKCDTERSELG